MRLARRLFGFTLAALVALAAATPLEALACGSAAPCPMMKLMKGAKAPCHPARSGGEASPSGMSTPMSCCSNPQATPTAAALAVPALSAATTPVAAAVVAAPGSALAAAEPRADRAALGLYTLHAVWRI